MSNLDVKASVQLLYKGTLDPGLGAALGRQGVPAGQASCPCCLELTFALSGTRYAMCGLFLCHTHTRSISWASEPWPRTEDRGNE